MTAHTNYLEMELLALREILIANGQMVVDPKYVTELRARITELEAALKEIYTLYEHNYGEEVGEKCGDIARRALEREP